ncbi:Flavine halogenase aclH [Penicillium fimorum]|uniref:Flavine halogenase aclH n=1 Tax=Penicillium fimorum TaxID=1882269 RepID=A0A9X0C8L7_9EURO|nr:Flavine halogenase aclH [Penicillium fimorum]
MSRTNHGTDPVAQSRLSETLDFCAQAWNNAESEEKVKVIQKLEINGSSSVAGGQFSREEFETLRHIQARKAMYTESAFGLDCFYTGVIDGLRAV